jgi:hypothetical protein
LKKAFSRLPSGGVSALSESPFGGRLGFAMQTYKILGSDQKEYGPITGAELKQWVDERRANAQTQIAPAEGGAWRTLGSIPEFAPWFRSAPPVSPAAPEKTSGLAIVALVFSILGLCGLLAPVGFVLGIIALVKIRNSGGRLGGAGLAIASICLSGFFLVMIPFEAAMLLPALAAGRMKAQGVECAVNARTLTKGITIYSNEHGGQLPDPAAWCDAILPSVGGSPAVFQCPDAQSLKSGYAFNSRLKGIKLSDVRSPHSTVLLFESDGGWNASGGPEMMLQIPRHRMGIVVAFCDGNIQWIRGAALAGLRWDP